MNESANPWIINRTQDGKPFRCTEMLIKAQIAYFHLASNSTINREINILNDTQAGLPPGLSLTNIKQGIFPVFKAESENSIEPSFKLPVFFKIKLEKLSEGKGMLKIEIPDEPLNNYPHVAIDNLITNRGVETNFTEMTGIRWALGYLTNLMLRGCWMEIWIK